MKARLVLLSLAAASSVLAGEATVSTRPLRIEKSFTATLLPAKATALSVDPQSWADYEILEIKPHGSAVKKGDALVKFDREGIDRKLVDQRRAVELQTLGLASRELAYSKLEEETKLKLEAAQRAARVAAEDLDYFLKTDLKLSQDQAKDALETSQQRLEGEREELNQLKKMYQADDVVEETEEIVLKRQQFAVKSAELRYHAAELSTKRTLEVLLPREQEGLQAADRNAKIALEKATQDLPRGLQSAKLELDAAKISLEREKAELAKLEADSKLMTLVAANDGTFYHGAMEDGRWSAGSELARVLVKGGKAPLSKTFATLVPAAAQALLDLEAQVDEATLLALPKGQKGIALAPGREELTLSAAVKSTSAIPGVDGRFRLQLDAEWEGHKNGELPADLTAGMTFDCNFLVYQNEAAVVIPAKALRPSVDGGWAVDVKLADGKTEVRTVKRGRTSGNWIELLSGVEPGQVVILPD